MSSMRNAVQRRVHRERAQPHERERLGLLEKHKDYSLRAKDYSRKKAQLRALRRKAADRNEDEFYFGMLSRRGPAGAASALVRPGGDGARPSKKWSGTVAGDRGARALDVDAVRLLKTQDLAYVRTARNAAAKRVRGLEERVAALGGDLDDDDDDDDDDEEDEGPTRPPRESARAPRKIVFADAPAERDAMLRARREPDADGEDGAGAASPADAPAAAEKESGPARRAPLLQQKKHLARLRRQLQAARRKLRTLARAEQALEVQRAKMAKTPTAMTGVTKAGNKFKVRERKR
ncbi:U3 small nucleolar RNA-associated protein 11 [Durotheca rogersii]|uniref:U3 small nucleolar RNA-associated protein 11 n=1 Tax=Durotheca rogersii TaxID=419775 RepID=UPI00221F83BE|nr:U3 small nucleolar RNA-associated protein 11 [Durotheca rogersii]KAI5864879.1 U3 small nucleolar RNA-associated protein 11 [Durotheca rogersii]